jgi:hypothetical protein
MTTSPFETHREKVLGHYSTAAWLRSVVMALYSGSTHKVGLSNLASVDAEHYKAFSDMIAGYRQNGENDRVFMALAIDVIKRQKEEAAAEEREAALEGWCGTVKSEMRIRGIKPHELDDHYSWFEGKFDIGMTAADAMEAFSNR